MALQVLIHCDIPNACYMEYTSEIAEAPQDYDRVVSRVIPFDRCDTYECIRIQIVNDLVLEGDKSFNVSLTSPVGEIAVSPSRATVNIIRDADSKLYVVRYKKPSN